LVAALTLQRLQSRSWMLPSIGQVRLPAARSVWDGSQIRAAIKAKTVVFDTNGDAALITR
jgi:hypothetical protein